MEIKAEELSKPETRTNKRMLFPRNDKMVSDNNFASVASGANAVLEKAIKGIARFLESKTKLLLGEINLEVLVDSNYTCWIIGSKGINFYNTDGHLEKDTEKEGLVFPKHALKHFFSCPGTYCRFSGETNYHQEGDEAVNLYKKNLKHQTYEIPFKSVILDVIEKCKQIDRLKVSFPELSLKHILQFVEANPFQLRKYYSIGELLQSYLFRGYRVSNLYGNIKVCYNCHFIYGKIDGYRIQKVTKPENLEFNKEQAQAIIDKYFEDNALISSRNERPKKEVFSAAFYEKLEAFDKDILYLLGLEKKVETLEDFFEMTSAKLRNLSPLPERRSEVSVKSRASVTPSVRFPTINKEIIRDPRNIVSRERLRMPAGRQAEVIGCKHYLGHAKYLKDTGAGYALSKSSIHLNRLHDKLQKFRVNTDYGGDNVVEDSSTKDGTDYHSRIYTEDSKMQLNASQEEPRQLFHQRIKGLYAERQSENNNNSLFDVAVQKVHFLSDKEKDDLFERERKEKEKETQQKSFYSQNNLLAQSVLKNPLLATKSASSKNLLDQNFLIRVEENTKIRR